MPAKPRERRGETTARRGRVGGGEHSCADDQVWTKRGEFDVFGRCRNERVWGTVGNRTPTYGGGNAFGKTVFARRRMLRADDQVWTKLEEFDGFAVSS